MNRLPKRVAHAPNLPQAREAPPLSRRRRDVRMLPPDRRAFDRWIDRGLALDGYYRELMAALEPFEEGASSPEELRAAKELLFRRPADELAASTARFLEGLAWFERDELYDQGYEDDEDRTAGSSAPRSWPRESPRCSARFRAARREAGRPTSRC